MLHPQIFEMIAIAKHNGFSVELITNGTLLDEQRSQALLDSGLDLLRVSLWASSPEEYTRNYSGRDSEHFEHLMERLRRLTAMKTRQHKKNLSIGLQYPINARNYHSLARFVDLAAGLACDFVSFSLVRNRQGAFQTHMLSSETKQHVIDMLRQLKKTCHLLGLKQNIDQTLLRYKIGEAVWDTLPCYIGWLTASIQPEGHVGLCSTCPLTIGNLYEQPFREIWNSPTVRRFRTQTITREGLAAMKEHCDCSFCCYVKDNIRVHRIFKWLAPFVR